MADVTVKTADDFQDIETMYEGAMKKARAGLGVTSFGMQLIEMEPHQDAYPEHDHAAEGMEEVYVCLEGAGTLLAGGAEYALEPGVMARVGPGEKRKIVTGDERVRILALGGTPGEAFEPPAFSEETRSDL